ncbi:MAG: hypothetical protein DDT41_01233 [candidate division WS2 bacterium]|nr:hypothetical protein [Candidatus Psychracetigena formicireducens]
MSQTQYQSMQVPTRLPLVVATANRNFSFTKDSRLVNCYIETNEEGELWIYKRPGHRVFYAAADSPGQGSYFWRGNFYHIANGTISRNGVTFGPLLNIPGGVYHFSETLGARPRLVFSNGAEAYATDGTVVSATLRSININFPAATVKGIVYLNGATYVMDVHGQIWGSAINSVDLVGDWSAINFISSQAEPDPGVFLGKQLVYLIAFNQWSTEVFFDAGNPLGSPLGPVQGSKISFGCAAANSVQRIDDKLLWISSTRSASVQVSMLNQLNHQVISTEAIDRLVQSSNLQQVQSLQLKIDGHNFYILSLLDIRLTLVYDIQENLWHQWTGPDGRHFPFLSYGHAGSRHLIQHESNGDIYEISTRFFSDIGNDGVTLMPIISDIYTPNFDANVRRNKQLSAMEFIGDQTPGSILEVSNSDDDYQTWSNFRLVDLSYKRPRLINCGTFRRRAYNFRHRSNTPLRLQAVELQYDLGTL